MVLFTVAGIPWIYAGDEQAFRGIKEEREGGDDAVRPAFPAEPAGLAPHGWPIYRLHQRLIALRRRNAWLQTARLEVTLKKNELIAYTCRSGERRLSVVLNLGEQPYIVAEPLHVLLASTDQPPTAAAQQLVVEPHGWLVSEPA